MPIYNFQKRFAAAVKNGTKRRTLRNPRKRPTKVNDTLYLYSGLRTKNSEKLGTFKCVAISLITVIDNTAIQNGFKPFPTDFNPDHNWFGVSHCAYVGYTPDAILARKNKTITLSLQGLLMPNPKTISEEWLNIARQDGLKYMAFHEDGVVLYETYFGKMPEASFIEKFIEPL